MKKFKDFLAHKGISESDFQNKSAEEVAKLNAEYQEWALEDVASKEDVKAVEDQIKGLATQQDIKKQNDTLGDIQEQLNVMKEKQTVVVGSNGSLRDAIKAALLENKDSIERMKDNSGEKAQIVVKAPVAMTFATNTTGNVGRTERDNTIHRANRRTPILLDMVDTKSTNAKTFEWIEKTGHEGGVAMVAEGTVKPQGDWDLSISSQSAKKDAIIVTVSKEMLDDIEGMASDVEDEIYEQIRLFTESQVIEGDGTGNNIVGLDANATPYVAGSFADTVAKANEFDVLRTAVNQVELNNDYPTHILMHPSDATAMELVKDATTSQYVMPPFASVNGNVIKGLPIRTSTLVSQGTAYVGNFNRYKVKIREEISFEMGYRGAAGDWERNMVSLLGEQRFFGFIPAVHYGSIVKVDFTVAKALLDPAVA